MKNFEIDLLFCGLCDSPTLRLHLQVIIDSKVGGGVVGDFKDPLFCLVFLFRNFFFFFSFCFLSHEFADGKREQGDAREQEGTSSRGKEARNVVGRH
jgi:hypothetical protein